MMEYDGTGNIRLPLSLAAKLGSIIVHAEEHAATGHPFDKVALDSALSDPEVIEFMRALEGLGLVPVKRGDDR